MKSGNEDGDTGRDVTWGHALAFLTLPGFCERRGLVEVICFRQSGPGRVLAPERQRARQMDTCSSLLGEHRGEETKAPPCPLASSVTLGKAHTLSEQ